MKDFIWHTFVCVILIFGVECLFAQGLTERVFDPPGSHLFEKLFPAADGGAWALIHRQYSPSLEDSAVTTLAKLDDAMNVVWSKKYAAFEEDRFLTIAELADGGIMVGGFSENDSSIAEPRPLLMRLTSTGEVLWSKVLDVGYQAEVRAILPFQGDQFLSLCRSPDQDRSTLIFFDENAETFAFSEPESEGPIKKISGVLKLSPSTFLIGGDYYDLSLQKRVLFLAELNGQEVTWARRYAFELGIATDNGFNFVRLENGDIGFTAHLRANTPQTTYDVALALADDLGGILWAKSFNNPEGNNSDFNTGLISNGQNGLIHSFGMFIDGLRVSHFSGWDPSGESMFIQTVSASFPKGYHGYQFRRNDGLYVLKGNIQIGQFNDTDAGLLTLQGPMGEMPCDESSASAEITELFPEVLSVPLELEAVAYEVEEVTVFQWTFPIATYINCSSTLGGGDEASDSFSMWTDHKGYLWLESEETIHGVLRIHDTSGKLQFSRGLTNHSGKLQITLPHLSAGLYLVEFSSGGNRAIKKIMVN